jgi:hypothetical protein
MPHQPTVSEFADDQHRAQAEEFMLELGRFAVAFERVCEAMRHTVQLIFESEGLKHQGLARVVIGDKGSAELQLLVGALFTELRSRTDQADQKAVQALLKEVDSLTEARNLVVHGAWRFGNNAAYAEFYATTVRPRTKKTKGAVPELQGVSASYLRELTERSNALQVKLQRLLTCVVQKGSKVSDELARPL